MSNELSTPIVDILPVEYKILKRITDLWANNVPDVEIREVLHINTEEWENLMRVMKDINPTEGDNRIALEKYKAKQRKRLGELKNLRNYAESQENLGTAIKCLQLESDIDRSLIEYGQKLNILKGETVESTVNIKTDVRLIGILAHLTPEQQKEATFALNDLTQTLLSEGIKLDDN